MSTGKVVLGTLAGFAIGAIAGVLLAPEKGSVTRRKIMDKGDNSLDELKSKFDEFRDSLADKFKSTKIDAEELIDKGKEVYEDTKEDVKNTAENFKHNVKVNTNHKTM
ncbi:MAG TPA: YtxH domain-containing protein [Paludibacter sp.]|nr:YtxH domain-containing protein [Paludibacter sp.]